MRILIVSDVSSWMLGGVPAETRGLVEGLLERGHAVALASDAPLAGTERALHLPVTLPVTPRLRDELTAAMASFEPDFVHVICMNSKGLIYIADCLRHRRWAVTVHSVPPHENKLLGWHRHNALHYALRNLRYLPNRLAWRYVFRRVHVPCVVVHSAFVRNVVASHGYPPEQVVVIPLFFRADTSGTAAPARSIGNAPKLLTIGGLTHSKGQRDVTVALPGLVKRYPHLCYHMVGEVRDASYVVELQRLAREVGVAAHIRISSDFDAASLEQELASADVYVQPSHEEGFCLAYAEAAGRIARLVGTDTGAIAAMSTDDEGASVVPAARPEALAIAIAHQLAMTFDDGHMQRRIDRLHRDFGFDGYIEAHERLYGDVQGP